MKRYLFTCICMLLACTLRGQQAFLAENSVLATGDWVKIGCTQTGIYKIDASLLNQMGFQTASINPDHIRVHGNGGAMLAQPNSAPRADDLVENAIQVVGGEDGSFDASDYILFYGQAAGAWDYRPEVDQFRHQLHYYSDTNFYFISVGNSPGLRIQPLDSPTDIAVGEAQFRAFQAHEAELDNVLGGSGRHWLGELFDNVTTRRFSFYLPDAAPAGKIRLRLRVAARASSSTQFELSSNGSDIGSIEVLGTALGSETADHYKQNEREFILDPSLISLDSLSILLEYKKRGSSSEGWLDWIEVDYDVQPQVDRSNAFVLRGDPNNIQTQDVRLSGSGDLQIWDVSNPLSPSLQPFEQGPNSLSFKTRYLGNKAYHLDKGSYLTPASFQSIPNQNLHGMENVDYLIISHPLFFPAAERLAAFHQSHYQRTTAIVDPRMIYNEYASGKLDVTAIRDFIRMFYVRSEGKSPGHVLLFGDGSYDPKNIRGRDFIHNFVPTYQSINSWRPPSSFTSDDYYVLLDENEGSWGERTRIDGDNQVETHFLDIGIGRLPTTTLQEANRIVDKIIDYATNAEGLGNWRSRVVLVADHKPEDGNTHISQANNYTSQIARSNPCMQVDKYFMDNYELVPTASRPSFPGGRSALLEALDEGSLLVNYTGHGGETGWSDASIFTNTDIQRMKNGKRLPAVVTATCEFGKFDNPELRSGAEEMLLRDEGGAIALLTTVRLVFSRQNNDLNQSFYDAVFTFNQEEGRMPTLGEIMKETKNNTFPIPNTDINSRNFTLLGDPGLILNYPNLNAHITRINGNPIDNSVEDTLKSLSIVTVEGEIQDQAGRRLENYQGNMEVVIFDKPTRFETQQFGFTFFWQQNRVFDGKATIEEGNFNFQFMVPIDISYDEGQGKMSLYFFDEEVDGAGCYSNFSLGGTADQVNPDNAGPEVQLFLNDETWVDGGLTGPSPILIANLSDPSGINTVGGGIGHEIIGILDENESEVILLNNFYSADPNTFTSGRVRYPIENLSPGEHSLTLRVWDGANNPSQVTTNFRVAESPQDALGRIANIPNPFREGTQFFVNHNQAGKPLHIQVQVYTMTGQRVWAQQEEFLAIGNNFQGMDWDGRDFQGNSLVPGIYLYEVTVTDRDTEQAAREVERLVIQPR